MSSKRGRKPKGDREQFAFRLPRTHLEIYRKRALDAGMPLGDYLAIQLAAAHGFDEPAYIKRPDDAQEALPISA